MTSPSTIPAPAPDAPPTDPATQARRDAVAGAEDAMWALYRQGAAQRAAAEARYRWPECRPSDDVYGPLYGDAYAVVWPSSGGGGTCSHRAPDSCPDCDGSAEEAREAARDRRRSSAPTTTGATR